MKKDEKKAKNKHLVANIFKIIGLVIFLFIIFFILFIEIITLIVGKENIANYYFIIALASSALISVLLTFFMFKYNKKYPFLSGGKWIKFLFSLVVIVAFIGSINPEINIDINYARELLGYEWTIFSLIVVLFLAWLVIVEKYLEKEPTNNAKGADRLINLINKNSYYINSLSYLFNGIFIIVNLILLCFLTSKIYTFNEVTLFNQILLYFNIYLSINTLQLIFTDIFSPIIAKLYMCRKYKVKENEVEINIMLSVLEKLIENSKKENSDTAKEQNDGQAEHED